VLPSSLIVRVHSRLNFGAPPPSAEQSHRSFPYIVTASLPYLTIALSSCPNSVGVTSHYCSKSFSCNTYGSPRKCCKQKTYCQAKSFRCNTYKNTGEGSRLLLTRNPHFSPSSQRGAYSDLVVKAEVFFSALSIQSSIPLLSGSSTASRVSFPYLVTSLSLYSAFSAS